MSQACKYPEKFKGIPGSTLFYTLCSILDPMQILYRPISACDRFFKGFGSYNSLIFSCRMNYYMFIGRTVLRKPQLHHFYECGINKFVMLYIEDNRILVLVAFTINRQHFDCGCNTDCELFDAIILFHGGPAYT